MPVIILVADGARPDTLSAAMDSGAAPNLARLRRDGSFHTVTTTWPSVTGVAYAPFLMGRFPGRVGLPGLRWFDRSRRIGRMLAHTRSYVGLGMRHIDADLAPDTPTLFELTDSSLGALTVIGRGLRDADRLGRGARFVARAAATHFSGDVGDWLAIDREIGATVVRRVRHEDPQFVFAAFTGIDKTSHAAGHDSSLAREAITTIDQVVAELRHDAERAGCWEQTHLWIVSDHGHSPVDQHDDLALLFRDSWGFRTLAHPWTVGAGHEVAVMVSGNAMAHLYLELKRRERPYWPTLRNRWGDVAEALLARESVDLLMLPHGAHTIEVRGAGRGAAMVRSDHGVFSYHPLDGDPLGVGELHGLNLRDAFDATAESEYPDAVVQIAQMAAAPRSGEMMLSAARGWDFRERYEPIPHCSTHGGLHRDHMLAPLLLNHPIAHHPLEQPPRRTVDVMPSALAALGLPIPPGLDGESFLAHAGSLALSTVE
ncbi:MAG: alkaline phosphatase family protein [Gemmatimonadota bacterium]